MQSTNEGKLSFYAKTTNLMDSLWPSYNTELLPRCIPLEESIFQ